MSDFIACAGCGATIYHTAPACPKCGAPQASPEKLVRQVVGTSTAPALNTYAQTPWYRRRWFVLLCLVTLTPVASVLAKTGALFYDSKGIVKQFPQNIKNGMMIATLPWAISVFGSGSSAALAAIGLIIFASILAFKK